MKKTMAFFALATLVGCNAHTPVPSPLPQGNMPMTQQEYQEAERLLLKKQPLPADERAE
ncbi:hypothetical protein KVG88_00375 [Pseudomonas sp. SWRI74]|uniref:Lipoprotein n=1 Tax=Pseudomonas azerbaijanoccidentalis TaxID=2842347 RepID=A0ABS6QHX5_9PSED|nr:hypothetical protein [Pseudomonas azerbaijanoccidentalis]MBV4518503.1 hypothetical protein [Pseudomonas azerbaijanoccidentalis]